MTSELSNRLLLRVFRRSILLAALSLAILVAEALVLPGPAPGTIIGPLLALMHQIADVIAALTLVSAGLDAGARLWQLRRWETGKGAICHRCGGPIEVVWNRHRPQVCCWFCGGRRHP